MAGVWGNHGNAPLIKRGLTTCGGFATITGRRVDVGSKRIAADAGGFLDGQDALYWRPAVQ
jgi:hypothetical protein